MAQRRMFSKGITNSSEFLMMSQSAQNLYFHFGMNADDDGFCEVFAIMRMTDSKPDDLQSLHSRGFVFVIDNKICVVKDWHENNQLRLDRYKKSKYLDDPNYKEIYKTIMEEKIKEISLYSDMLSSGKPNGNQMVPQDSIGKIRLGKDSIKNIYGEFKKVQLTDDEHQKLIELLGEKNTNILIAELDEYIASKGKRYSSHYATIRTWARRRVNEIKDKSLKNNRFIA